MERKDYELVARVLQRCARYVGPSELASIRLLFADAFEEHNPRFNAEKFLKASQPQQETN